MVSSFVRADMLEFFCDELPLASQANVCGSFSLSSSLTHTLSMKHWHMQEEGSRGDQLDGDQLDVIADTLYMQAYATLISACFLYRLSAELQT